MAFGDLQLPKRTDEDEASLNDDALPLHKCLDKFCELEELGEDDRWYCSQCRVCTGRRAALFPVQGFVFVTAAHRCVRHADATVDHQAIHDLEGAKYSHSTSEAFRNIKRSLVRQLWDIRHYRKNYDASQFPARAGPGPVSQLLACWLAPSERRWLIGLIGAHGASVTYAEAANVATTSTTFSP